MLVVFQKDIVFRHEFLDEIALQGKRLHFAVDLDRFKVGDMRNHGADLRRMILGGLKILPDTVFQDLCLSDVDHRAGIVQHLVYAWLFGKQSDLVFQYRVHERSSATASAFSSISYSMGAVSPTTV